MKEARASRLPSCLGDKQPLNDLLKFCELSRSIQRLKRHAKQKNCLGSRVDIDAHLSFLTLITDMMTRRLPKIAAMMIKIIIDAEKTVIKILIHS